MNQEDAERIIEAKKCEGCIGWHKHCNAECCRTVSLNVDISILDAPGKYLLLKVGILSPSDQRYYMLRDIRYTRGTLRLLKERIHIFGRRVLYIHTCKMLDKDNLCSVHGASKPKICKALTIDTSDEMKKDYFITDNCLFKYKVKGGYDNGRK